MNPAQKDMDIKKISGITHLAIQRFAEIVKQEKTLDRKNAELSILVSAIPNDEMDYYVEQTSTE